MDKNLIMNINKINVNKVKLFYENEYFLKDKN